MSKATSSRWPNVGPYIAESRDLPKIAITTPPTRKLKNPESVTSLPLD